MSQSEVCGLLEKGAVAAAKPRSNSFTKKLGASATKQDGRVWRGRRAVESRVAVIATEALNHPEAWIDTTGISDADFLALLRQGKRGR